MEENSVRITVGVDADIGFFILLGEMVLLDFWMKWIETTYVSMLHKWLNDESSEFSTSGTDFLVLVHTLCDPLFNFVEWFIYSY